MGASCFTPIHLQTTRLIFSLNNHAASAHVEVGKACEEFISTVAIVHLLSYHFKFRVWYEFVPSAPKLGRWGQQAGGC